MLSPKSFFTDFFPESYICATDDNGAQFDGSKITENFVENIKQYQVLNSKRHNIFFTPNGAKNVLDKNKLSNIKHINAWWTDIDINETKQATDEETLIIRDRKKSEILGFILGLDIEKWPSLTIETRNGYQLYWFADREKSTLTNFSTIAESVFDCFKHLGADHSVVKVMQLMRMPFFWYFKRGEQGKIKIVEPFSSMKKYSDEEMMTIFPPVMMSASEEEFLIKPSVFKTKIANLSNDKDDIFCKVTSLPIDEVLQKVSGTELVNGDVITLQKKDVDRSNILINGKLSPNWIVRSKNHIYSNNAKERGPTIIQYLHWYPWTNKEIAAKLKVLFA